jgi:hypothetical protein
LLDGVELFADSDALDGGDLSACSLQNWDEAGVDEVVVEEDGAGPALAFSATFLRSGKVEVFAEDVEEALHGWGFDGLFFVVDDEGDQRHAMALSVSIVLKKI